MKKQLKELIENAPYRIVGDYRCLMIISNGTYNGFWGKNGYNNILVLGQDDKENQWYKIAEYVDVLTIEHIGNCSCNVDIPEAYGMPVLWFRRPIHIENTGISSLTGELVDNT